MGSFKGAKRIHLFRLNVVVLPSALGFSGTLFVFFAVLSLVRGDSLAESLVFGVGVVLVHTLALLGHHLGHAAAARLAGYPMTGIVAKNLIWRSAYPPDEPVLPARLHAVRALGGPAASLILTGVSVVAWAGLAVRDDGWSRLMLLASVDNGLVFTLGALLPLGFTDGSTLLNLVRWGRPEN